MVKISKTAENENEAIEYAKKTIHEWRIVSSELKYVSH